MDILVAFNYVTGAEAEKLETDWGAAFPADLLTIAWTELWTETANLPDMRRFDRLMFDADNAADNGYLWLAAELYEAAARYAEKPHDEPPRKLACALREKISPDYQTAATTVRIREPWEKTLAGIEKIASQVKPAKKPASKVATEGRLAWAIKFDEEFPSEWDLMPIEQKLGKTRKWNKPRVAPPRRLFENPPPFLTDADRKAIAKLNQSGHEGGGYDFNFKNDAAIAHLISHPLLFLDEELTRPVELAKRDTQLVLQQHISRIRLPQDALQAAQ